MNKSEAIELTQANSVQIRLGRVQKEKRRLRFLLKHPLYSFLQLLAPPKQTSNGQDTEEVENLFGNTKSLESSPTVTEEAEKVKRWRIYSATLKKQRLQMYHAGTHSALLCRWVGPTTLLYPAALRWLVARPAEAKFEECNEQLFGSLESVMAWSLGLLDMQ